MATVILMEKVTNGYSISLFTQFLVHLILRIKKFNSQELSPTRRSLFFNYLGELWKSSIVLLKDGS